MCLLSVIKLANDYCKAKKLLKKSNINASDVKYYLESLHKFVEILKAGKQRFDIYINKAKEIMRTLSDKLKERKVGK